MSDNTRHIVQVYVGSLSDLYEALSVEASKQTTAEEIVTCIVERLSLSEHAAAYELAEVIGDDIGQECKVRSLGPQESPVQLKLLWPKNLADESQFKFYLREKANDCMWHDNFVMDTQLVKDYFHRFLYQPKDREYPDLCQLPDLNETTLLDNLRNRFEAGHIYTYVGSILISVNPFKFYPIYNPKYVKLYQYRRLGPNLPPHIFAVADTAYQCMLKDNRNQCIVISGESGSGKTESTNFLLHHLTALSQKGSYGSGVELTILSAGPVLEAFGNAKTAHNNNSSRFGKFIQVNYKGNGMVHGAVVQKYLLEKSRICTQGRNERNYHVFYYLLEGANEQERTQLYLKRADQYHYLNRSGCSTLENVDEGYEFSRLKQSMEMVGFTVEKQRRLFAVLSAVLLLGNVEFQPRKSTYHHDESVGIKNPEVVALISDLLRVKQETLMQALTAKRARASGETLVINYRLPEAIATRDAMAKCLYGALFDWIVLQVNHALLSKKDTLREHQGYSIGVLDIFGFEDFGLCNSFEQLCINYANEHLQHYFNQHVFKYEQEEYRKEGIRWKNIEFMDNTGCLQLIEGKVNGLLCILDDQCNFPGATNETLLQKFNSVHKDNEFYQKPQKKEAAFIIVHYAGTVKYQVAEMREKNLDMMRQDIVGVLKNSSMAFVRELVGADPVAVFRWAIVRAFFRAYFAFQEAGRRHRQGRVDGNKNNIQQRYQRNHVPNDNIISKQRNTLALNRLSRGGGDADAPTNHNRLSWPQFYNRGKSSSTTAAAGAASTSKNNAGAHDAGGRKEMMAAGGANTSTSAVLERVMCPDQARVMQRANQIVMKNKSFRPRERGRKGLKNLQSVKTLAGKTGITAANQGQLGKARKQPMTVTAQFQQSLHSLMDTLNQANPFFIRCIKSNSRKVANDFDEETVQRQLRYTGMLETVRIRQAGFNVRLTYDEFIQLYRILLPKGLLSSQLDVRDFLATLNLDRDNYQLGCSKVFLRESEKSKLDSRLHQQIMASIVRLQRWFRACLERRRFLRMHRATIMIQSYCRMYLEQKKFRTVVMAAVRIQKQWRAHTARIWYTKQMRSIVRIQALGRGYLARKAFAKRKQKVLLLHRRHGNNAASAKLQVIHHSSDESFVHPHDIDPDLIRVKSRVSEESSGYGSRLDGLEDLESIKLTAKACLRSTQSLPSVTTRQPIAYSAIYNHNRLEDTKQEGTVLDQTIKLVKSVDISDAYPLAPRRSSGESINSNRSYPRDYAETTSSANKLQWMLRTKSETDSDGATYSSNTPSTQSFDNYDLFPYAHNQRQLAQMPGVVRQHPIVKREQRPDAKLVSFPPIRRRDITDFARGERELPELRDNYSVYDLAPDKAKQMLGVTDPPLMIPKPPSRNARGHRRTLITRSHIDDVSENLQQAEKNQHLGTIDEFSAHSKILQDSNKLTKSVTDFSASCAHMPSPKHVRPGGSPIRRRNSDPATKISGVSDQPIGGSTPRWAENKTIVEGGHTFRVSHTSKSRSGEDHCVSCKKPLHPDPGLKCLLCKKLFHVKCIQNKIVIDTPCVADSQKPGRRKQRKSSRAPHDLTKQSVNSNFKKTGASEFTDRTDQIISDSKELEDMQNFISSKILNIEQQAGEKPSEVDKLFKQALREFKDNLVQLYSTANKNGTSFDAYSVKYKDLITNFMQAMETVCQREQKDDVFPVTMGVNAFRGFMDEFMNSRGEPEKPSKSKKKKEKKRKLEERTLFNGHTFQLTILQIQTVCEICSQRLMWPIERGLVCQSCKLTCHRKCYSRCALCQNKGNASVNNDLNKIFGVPLESLLGDDDKIPVVIERLLATIEKFFLYTEGLYRKPGVSSKVKELKVKMEEEKCDVNFEQYQVHVLASVLKCFLREMPEPLLTFECYENFIRVAGMSDPQERMSTLYDMLKKLPTANYDLMERLVFHLARVALREEVNRMSAASLAIVFAPCILRTNKQVPAQDSLHDISSQTQCIEIIISEKLRKMRSTLDDIDTLDTACQAATNRLSSLRSSKVFNADDFLPSSQSPSAAQQQVEDEENLLENHIHEIQKEKEHLTSTLPTLAHATSDDDMLSTDGSFDDIYSAGEQKRMKGPGPVIRTLSAGNSTDARQSQKQHLGFVVDQAKIVDECTEDAPIMV